MCTYVVVIGVRVHLGMTFIKINSIKYNFCKYLLTKTWKTSFFELSFPIQKYRLGRNDSSIPSTFWQDTMTPLKVVYLWFFSRQHDRKGWTYNIIIEAFGKSFAVLAQPVENSEGEGALG